MREKRCPFCDATIAEDGANFCGNCGNTLSSKTVCPQCGETVDSGKFCSSCGADMLGGASEAEVRENIWVRGEDDFAINLPPKMISKAYRGGLDIRHGTKALFFEEGRLVEVAESGRYTTQEGGFLKKLEKGKALSAVLVDAGDVPLHFEVGELRTKDNLFTDIALDVVLRLEDPNDFFVHVMKERQTFKVHELRSMLYGEVKNALQESVRRYDFNDLNTNRQTKNELSSRMEAHLRQTLGRTGFEFGQVRTLSVQQQEMDAAVRAASDAEVKARTVEAETKGQQRVRHAELSAAESARQMRDRELSGKSDDMDLEMRERFLEAGFIEKRFEVYKKLQKADLEQIKTDEDFRKFKLEVDREQVLDDTEWKEFEDEIQWKKEDRTRDRSFLVDKIERQQDFDKKRLDVVNNAELELEAKKRQLDTIGYEQKTKRQQELEQAEHDTAMAAAGAKKTTVADEILDDAERTKFGKWSDTKIEAKRKKARMGLDNLADLKKLKREDEAERMRTKLEGEGKTLDMRMKEKEQAFVHKRDFIRETKDLNIEQLIAISGQDKAEILGDLAKSQTMKGMSPDEIMAMKDPAAFGKALEERAKNTQSDELKVLYERLLSQSEKASDKVAEAHLASADRAERMHAESVKAMGGQQHHVFEAERRAADRAERISDRAMDRMGEVAGGKSSPTGGRGKVQVCGNCKREVDTEKNFCPNCGHKMY